VRQDHAEGREPDDAGGEALRAIFGEKASDVRDTELRVPPGVTGTIVEVRVFNRHGVDKDERAQAIEREEIERLAKDRDDEQAILDRNTYARLSTSCRADGRRPARRASRRTRSSPGSSWRVSRARNGGSSPSSKTG
jgi:DNA-directed RNA polymerase beta subunit